MPEYLAPGVYVEEVASGPRPIEGVSTSTSGMVGMTQRGPLNVATLVTSFSDFVRKFGGYLDDRVYTGSTWYLPHAVEGFFTNGGRRLYVVRVLPESATAANSTLFDLGNLDANGINFTGFTGVLAAQAAQNSQILLIEDTTGLENGASLLIQDEQFSEYVELVEPEQVGEQPGVVALATPLTTFWPEGTLIADSNNSNSTNLTRLLLSVNVGDVFLPVENVTAITAASQYNIGPPASPETLDAATVIGLTVGLQGGHAAGTQVFEPTLAADTVARILTTDAPRGSTQIILNDRTGITSPPSANTFLTLADGGGNIEIAYIDFVEEPRAAAAPDPGVVQLRQPLERDYTSGQTVAQRLDTNSDVGASTTTLTAAATPLDRSVWVESAFGAGAFIRISAFDSPLAEYHQVTANPPEFRIIQTPIRATHAGGTEIESRMPTLEVAAVDRGTWGNQLRVIVNHEANPLLRETTPETTPGAGNPMVRLRTVLGIATGSILEFFTRSATGDETIQFRQKVESIDGNDVTFGAGGLLQAVTADTRVRTVEFQLRVQLIRLNPRTQREEIVEEEFFRQLSLDPRHPNYVVRRVGPIFVDDTTTPLQEDGRTEGESNLIRMADSLDVATAETTLRASPDVLLNGQGRPFGLLFGGGNDDIAVITPAVYIGTEGTDPPVSRTGIFALKNEEDIAIVSVPGQTDQAVQEALLNHCELMRYRFAVLDSEVNSSLAEVQDQRSLYDSRYGALYYPWLRISDPFPENPRIPSLISLPPSGHMMGIYARTDIDRGVHKAPANELIRGITNLELKLTKEEQDVLNPNHVNVLRNFRDNNRGLRVWGARSLASDPIWRYVNVRRLFIFIENSIDRGTQWAVFEPNDEITWARLRRTVSAFLTRVWRNGALQGSTPEEAFFVRCDRTTMTQSDIDNGRLIAIVGIAPVKPAEFVIIRIGQKISGSEVEELV